MKSEAEEPTLENESNASETSSADSPISNSDRIGSLDVLRGFALLGILLLNIQSFGLLGAEYFNPHAIRQIQGFEYWTWFFTQVLGDLKFMAVFSMLFGAGVVLMWENAKRKGRPIIGLHYRRMSWLVVAGVLHAHLLWEGDILYLYGVCGFWIFWFKTLRPGWLISIGISLLAVGSIISILSGLAMGFAPAEDMQDLLSDWKPTQEQIADELAAMRGNWIGQLEKRSGNAVFMQTFLLVFWGIWRAGGLMLIGMGLFKLRILDASRSTRFYVTGACVGLIIGVGLSTFGVWNQEVNGWSIPYGFFIGNQFNYWGSVATAFGYVCVIMLMYRHETFLLLQKCLSAVGRMALTNYLLQTVIGTTLFYGHGFGWFAQLSRPQLLFVVVAVWLFQLVWSPIWLSKFRFGPAEWLWRSLSYKQWQPMSP